MKPMLLIRYTFHFLLIMISLQGFSQKEANIWYFGYEAGLDFNSGDPVTLTNSAMNQPEGCASISDSDGNILFYTNGMDVWDKSHSIMANGSGLMGGPSSSQSGIIVPKPESNSIYYIFTVPEEIGSTGLRYSVVDLSLNGGLGEITSKNIFLIEPTEEKVTAVKHANNKDIWVITHLWNSDAFYCYLVTSEGVNTTPVISNIGTYHSGIQGDSHGCMKASPDGNKLGIIVRCIDSFELFDFDDESGQILSPITFPSVFDTPYGIEFSLDCSRLYISDYGSGSKIYQYNLEAGSPAAIINSKIQVGSVSTSHIGSLQLAPNEKIYVSNNTYTEGNPYLSVINNPTVLGTGCNFEEDALYLAGKKCVFGLPNFIQTNFDQVQDFNFINTCFNDTTFFHLSFQGVDSVSWDFDDPETGSGNYSSELNPYHIFSSPALYSVMLISYFNDNTDTIIKNVLINQSPQINLGNDTSLCTNELYLLSAGQGNANYLWQDGSTDSTFMVTTSGLYWVEVTNEFGCTATDSIQIELFPSPEINLGNDTLICEGDTLNLNAGSGFASYLWNTGSSDPNIMVDTSGIFWVEVSNELGCSSTDTIIVDYYPFPFEDLDLGEDASFCYGEGFVLNPGSGYTNYLWQDGSTEPIYIADTAGTYFVYVSNPCGEAWDTINLEIFPVSQINLGNDTSVCYGDFVFLNAGDGFNAYLWQDGSQSPFLYAGQTGTYWVQATDDNLCPVSDTINLNFISPDPGLGNDTLVCDGETVVFSVLGSFNSYVWQDGSENSFFNANTAGLYWCQVTDTMGCVGSDSVMLNIEYPPNISLHNDTSICVGDSIWLRIYPTDSSFSFMWQDGSSDTALLANQQGTYWVQASNNCGTDSDSIHVSSLPLPYIFIGNDTILALNDQLLLDAGNGFDDYLWNDGSTHQTLTVSDSGMYWVNVFDGQCYNADSISIEPINCDLFVPNVFTPNDDGYNNYFYAIVSKDISKFNLVVFNRWSEKVWETDKPDGKWDGKRNGHPAAEGTYFWVVKYTCPGFPETYIKEGWVSLLR